MATAMGSQVLTNEYYIEHFKQYGKNIEGLLKAVGRDKHCIAKDASENSLTLGAKAADKLLAKLNLTGADIDLIIFATQLPEYTIPAMSCRIHSHIKGKKEATVFDLNTNCLGMINAMDVAKRYLADKDLYKNALIVGADQLSKHCQKDNEYNYPLFGDGACAMLLELDDNDSAGIIGTAHRTNCTGTGYAAFPECGLSDIAYSNGSATEISWDNPDIAKVPNDVAEAVNEILTTHEIALEDITWVCPTQLSLSLLRDGTKACKISEEKIIYVGDRYGYTGNSAPLIALHDGIEEEKIKAGDLVLLWTMGIGYTVGAMLLRI